MKKAVLIVLMSLTAISVFSQQRAQMLRGRIVDLKTQRPIENVHIINMSDLSGTVSDKGGFFSITAYPTDSIYVSVLSYKPMTIKVNPNLYNREYTSFYLSQEQYNLSEVVLRDNYLTGILDVDLRGLNPLFVEKIVNLPGIKRGNQVESKLSKPTVFQPVEYIYGLFSEEKKLSKIKQSSDIGAMLTNKYDRDFLMKSLKINSAQLEELLLFCNCDPKWVVKASDLEVLDALFKCQESMKKGQKSI